MHQRSTFSATVNRSSDTALWLLTGLAAVMFLRVARELLVPITIAVLVSYALEPLVARLQSLRVPRWLGAGMIMAALFGTAVWGAYALRDDAMQAVQALPEATRQAAKLLGGEASVLQAQEATGSPEVVQQGVAWFLSGAGHV